MYRLEIDTVDTSVFEVGFLFKPGNIQNTPATPISRSEIVIALFLFKNAVNCSYIIGMQ